MAAVGIAALSSSSAADLAGRPHFQSSGHLAMNGSWNGSHRPLKTNLQVQGSRLSTLRNDLRSSGSVTAGSNTVDRKLQPSLTRALTARNVVCNSQLESSNVATVDVQETFPNEAIHDRLAEGQQVSLYDTATQEQNPQGLTGDSEPHPYEDVFIGPGWREVHGENNWEGSMLNPLDNRLRSELVRYGEFAQATYDAFSNDEFSKFCGCCKYRKSEFFEKLGLKNRGYEIVEYIYTTSPVQDQLSNFFKASQVTPDDKWSPASNWAGFIAVCTSPTEIARLGRRDVVIAWRGTVTQFEWVADLELSLCPTAPDPWDAQKESSPGSSELKVEKGFLSLFEATNKASKHNNVSSAKEQVRRALNWLVKKFKGEQMSITVTGHSLGAALATLCAYDISEYLFHELEGRDLPMITTFVYGSPRVGNSAFKQEMEGKRNVKVLRVANVNDFVPCVPGLIFHEKPKFMWTYIALLRQSLPMKLICRAIDLIPATYSDVGVELEVDNLHSPFVKPTRNPDSAHNLELYLHLLAGLKDKDDPFSEELCTRDLALLNKSASLLKDRHVIPGAWFQEENKGLVRIGGRFTYRPILHEDFPEQPLDEDAFDKELHYIK